MKPPAAAIITGKPLCFFLPGLPFDIIPALDSGTGESVCCATARANGAANRVSAAYNGCKRCNRIGLTSVGNGGDQVSTFAEPRIVNGITAAQARPLTPGMHAMQRFNQPVCAPSGCAVPFSTQFCA